MLIWNTPAKINLFLNLLSVRHDGYHELISIMQTVGIYDQLRVSEIDPPHTIILTTNNQILQKDLEVNQHNNSIVSAYYRFWEMSGKEPLAISVHLKKGIPVQAGMGGGSANAASMLLMLNHLTGNALSSEDLEAMAKTLGSDVPFFIRGGTALATGRGEKISPIETPDTPLPILVVKPKAFGIPTAIAYQLYKSKGEYRQMSSSELLTQLQSAHDLSDLEPLLMNDFERVLFEKYPALDRIRSDLKALGIHRPLLSGSGPTMVGFVPLEKWGDIQEQLEMVFPSKDYDTALTTTLPKPYVFQPKVVA